MPPFFYPDPRTKYCLGLDRSPEVRTLRSKIATLCQTEERAAQWQGQLAQKWTAASTPAEAALAGLYYVDGHVRVYHGALTALPRRPQARLRQSFHIIFSESWNLLGFLRAEFFRSQNVVPTTCRIIIDNAIF